MPTSEERLLEKATKQRKELSKALDMMNRSLSRSNISFVDSNALDLLIWNVTNKGDGFTDLIEKVVDALYIGEFDHLVGNAADPYDKEVDKIIKACADIDNAFLRIKRRLKGF